MGKLEVLRTELEKARKKLNDKGIHYIGDASNYAELMNAKPFEIAYQDVIEKIWPDNAWWEVTHYWDIFDAMMGGLDDKAVIDEIIKHVDKEFIREAKEDTVNGAKVEYGHNYREYMDKFGDAYDNGELWDFSKEDFEGDAIEPRNITYWYMQDLEGDWRYFETNIANECIKEEKKLDEGTPNFGHLDYFPLLVFYTMDEFYYMMDHDPDCPHEEDFEKEDERGHYYIDDEAYENARDEFEQKYWDENKVCVLDEDEQERLENMLYDFNKESENMAYDADVNEDGEQEYGPNLSLEDVKLGIEPGYYSAAYIDVEHENYLDDLEDDFKEQQMLRFNAFFDQLRKEFGLTKLGVAWGPASNGETGYKILNDSLKENKEDVKEDAHQDDLGLPREVKIDLNDLPWVYFEDEDELDDIISDYLSDEYGFCHYGFNWKYSADAGYVDVYDIDWDTSEDTYDINELEYLEEKKSKKKYKINFTGDPAKNAAFFNHAMGSDKGDGGLQQGGTTLGEDVKRHYYEFELGVILEPGQGEYDSYKIDGVYGGELSFYDESQGAFPEDELDKLKEDCKRYVDEGVNGTYAIIKGPFDLDDDIEIDDIEEFDYDINNVIWSYRKDKDGNIVEDFLKVKEESLKESREFPSIYEYKERLSKIKSYEELKESIDFEEMKRLLDGLENFLREEDAYYELWFDEKDDTINAEIEWGDWKHDHLWFDHVATQYLKGQGYDVDVDVEVTDEDGSDTYSAIHSLKIRKKPKVEEGANYSKYAYYEYPKGSDCHVRETPSCFVATNKYGASLGDAKTKAGAEGIIDDYLANLKKVVEGLDDGNQYYYVKYWEDEELRDQGLSEIYMDDFKTKEEAIHVARRLIDFLGYASVEVFYSPEGDINENDDELVWGYDGIDTWGKDKNESLHEDAQYCIHLKVKDENGKVVKEEDLTPCGSKKEMEEKKKQLEEVSPEDSHHNRNFYSIKRL